MGCAFSDLHAKNKIIQHLDKFRAALYELFERKSSVSQILILQLLQLSQGDAKQLNCWYKLGFGEMMGPFLLNKNMAETAILVSQLKHCGCLRGQPLSGGLCK